MNIEKELQNYIGAIIRLSNQMYLESNISDKDDLIQAGTIGLINGLKSFSAEKAKKSGAKKSTYIIQCIRNAILQEANKFYGPLSLPYNKSLRLTTFKKLFKQGVEPENIKLVLNMDEDEYKQIYSLLDLSKVSELSDSIIDSKSTFNNDPDMSQIWNSIDLSKEEKEILQLKLSGMTYSKMAEHFSLSRETMRTKVHKILEKIRDKINKNDK